LDRPVAELSIKFAPEPLICGFQGGFHYKQLTLAPLISQFFEAAPLEGAWINGLQGGRLESGVFTGSPGRYLVDQVLARLAEG
jgi:hypothetical protein